MKTIGLLGGMSWESTTTYYQVINETIHQQLGGLHSAKLLLYSVDFHEIEICQSQGDWKRSAQILDTGIQALEKGGADFIVICTNTMHKIAPLLQEKTKLPILHIAETTAAALKKDKIAKAALLGTKYTMEQNFYKDKLVASGIEVLIPNEADRDMINHIIYDELCLGTISASAKKEYLRVISALEARGAQGVILGCTEIGLLIKQQDTALPVFDTSILHAQAAAQAALAEGKAALPL